MLYRRDALLRLGRIGLGAVTLPQLLRAEAERLCQALQHGLPALAARDHGKGALARRFDEGRLGQAGHRHRAAFAQGEQARVPEAADQHRVEGVRGVSFAQGRLPGIQHRMTGHRVAGLAGNVGRSECGGDRRPLPAPHGNRTALIFSNLLRT